MAPDPSYLNLIIGGISVVVVRHEDRSAAECQLRHVDVDGAGVEVAGDEVHVEGHRSSSSERVERGLLSEVVHLTSLDFGPHDVSHSTWTSPIEVPVPCAEKVARMVTEKRVRSVGCTVSLVADVDVEVVRTEVDVSLIRGIRVLGLSTELCHAANCDLDCIKGSQVRVELRDVRALSRCPVRCRQGVLLSREQKREKETKGLHRNLS